MRIEGMDIQVFANFVWAHNKVSRDNLTIQYSTPGWILGVLLQGPEYH